MPYGEAGQDTPSAGHGQETCLRVMLSLTPVQYQLTNNSKTWTSGVNLVERGSSDRSDPLDHESAEYATDKRCESQADELPRGHDEQVQTVPGVGKVRSVPDETHRHHLYAEFDGEEREDEVVEAFEDAAARSLTDLVLARSIHAQRQTVQQDHAHADPLKPRDVTS